MSRAQTLQKLLACDGPMTRSDITTAMGGDLPSIDAAMAELQSSGVMIRRNFKDGRGGTVYMLRGGQPGQQRENHKTLHLCGA